MCCSTSAASKAAQPQVDDKAAREADKSVLSFTQDAITALTKTCGGFDLPDANKTKEVLAAALELASGKMELVLARDAKLVLAPVDVRVITPRYPRQRGIGKESGQVVSGVVAMARCKGPAHRCQSGQRNRNPNRQPSDGNVPGSDRRPHGSSTAARSTTPAELARALNTLVVTSVVFSSARATGRSRDGKS